MYIFVRGSDAFSFVCGRVFASLLSNIHFPAYTRPLPPPYSLAESNNPTLYALPVAESTRLFSAFLGHCDTPIVHLAFQQLVSSLACPSS
jgi:hypothetical protein